MLLGITGGSSCFFHTRNTICQHTLKAISSVNPAPGELRQHIHLTLLTVHALPFTLPGLLKLLIIRIAKHPCLIEQWLHNVYFWNVN